MRTFASLLATVVAIIAMWVAVPSLWMQYRVIDRDGFTSFVEPMARDQQVRTVIGDEIARQIAAQTDVVPEAVIRPATLAYTRSDQFPADFADVLGQQHDFLFEPPRDAAARNDILELDLTAMVNRVVRQFGITGVSVTGPIRIPLSETRRSGLEAGRYHQAAQQITRLAYGSTALAVIAALAALALARRRALSLAALGAGAVIAGVCSYVVAWVLRDRAEAEFSGAVSSPRQVAQIIIEKTSDDLQNTALVVVVVGSALTVATVLVSALRIGFRR
ncbi:hypothetical protein [Williamsia sp. CHRR-6]|uniref:hypothetical protein n=1 Tax=Williamsia sp. CHRR-6 TaxID=2835871 RepID=UPI001BD9241B|nr:hypothetical protein [Williamsia sp. CHRR-6]MBT0566978.1 hypothetical protein [Williamsia sp. CHRR-6]